MVTLSQLFKINDDWAEDSFVNVFSVSEFLASDLKNDGQRLRMRTALSLYGEKQIYSFSGNTICVD